MTEFLCRYEDLRHDEACVNLTKADQDSNLWLYSLSPDCMSCPFTRIAQVTNKGNTSVKFQTDRLPLRWRILDTDGQEEFLSNKNFSGTICELSPQVGQFGLYELSIKNRTCNLSTIKEPVYAYTALFIIFGAIACLLLGFSILRTLWKLYEKKCARLGANEGPKEKSVARRRVNAIDTFRGASILLMIFVNNGSGGYKVLEHAVWNGLLVGDLVFPCFMWIMGVCIPIALSSQISRGTSKLALFLSIVKRSALLFLIGVSLNTLGTNSQLEEVRIFGVLQRFGISYLVVALIYLFLAPRHRKRMQVSLAKELQDLVTLVPQWCLILMILAMHCCLTFYLPVPNCPTGYLGPGGLHEDGKFWNCTGGATGYIDRKILGVARIYQAPTIIEVYKSGPFDPEGILGCLTSIVQVFLGVQAGQILMHHKDWKHRVVRWLVWAVLLGCTGSALHFTNTIPVNKNLWSLSFVLVTTSFALAFLSACYLLVDVARIWRGGPFRIPGMNALVMYVGHQVCHQIFPFHWRIGGMSTHAWITIEALWSTVLWAIIAYTMHRARTYVTL